MFNTHKDLLLWRVGEVVNAGVCKTSTRGFKSHTRLKNTKDREYNSRSFVFLKRVKRVEALK